MGRMERGLYLSEIKQDGFVWQALKDYLEEKRLQFLEEVSSSARPLDDIARGKVHLATTLLDEIDSEIEWALAEKTNKPEPEE